MKTFWDFLEISSSVFLAAHIIMDIQSVVMLPQGFCCLAVGLINVGFSY